MSKKAKKTTTNKTTAKKVVTTQKKKSITPTASRNAKSAAAANLSNEELLFGKQNYILMAASLGVIAIGFLLMAGGSMPSPDVWDESIIYSFRRITLAPFVVLVGLVLMIVAIFKK